MAETDPLFDLRTFFLLGNYQLAINEGTKLSSLDADTKLARDVLLYRCYIEQGSFQIVLDEVVEYPDIPAALVAVKLLALHYADPEEATLKLKKKMEDGISGNDSTFQLVSALIHYRNGDLEQALRSAYKTNDLQGSALMIQIYLAMSRVDLAEKELAKMQASADDAVSTQLATAWIDVHLGGDKYKDALYIYKELIEKYDQSVILLNGLAICHMHINSFPEAEETLLEALQKVHPIPSNYLNLFSHQDSKCAETIINLIVCYQHMKKPKEFVVRYLRQLKSIAPNHEWVKGLMKADTSFVTNAARYAVAL